jgi:hypothetical protein
MTKRPHSWNTRLPSRPERYFEMAVWNLQRALRHCTYDSYELFYAQNSPTGRHDFMNISPSDWTNVRQNSSDLVGVVRTPSDSQVLW